MENEERSIGKWISVLYREFQIYINQEIKEYGLNSSEYIYLVSLGRKEDVNLKFLTRELMIDPAVTTRVMKSLEKKGYVIREKCQDDKRAIIVRLTDKGRKIQPIILEKLKHWTELLSEGMTSQEVEALIERLKKMSKHARKITKGQEDD